MNRTYRDIIKLPHHVSTAHPQMSICDRAAQFAPFAALSGYSDDVRESARLTAERLELDEYEISSIDFKLRAIEKTVSNRPTVRITYFKPDKKKNGGSYVSIESAINVLDTYKRIIITENNTIIPIDDIYEIDSDDELFHTIT